MIDLLPGGVIPVRHDPDAAKAMTIVYQQVPTPPAPCAPLLKWAGGKQKLLPELLKRMPTTFGRYFEPFAGGAALFFHLARPGSFLADANDDLMGAYAAVARAPAVVSDKLASFAAGHREDPAGFYYERRDAWNTYRTGWAAATRAATLIYLNRTGYNGLYRTNRRGQYNVPLGRYANPTICDPQRIASCAKVLASATIWTGDYQTTTSDARAGDFVYFDPPYVPASPTARFTAYTADGFGEEQHRQLRDLARLLVQRGVYVMLSNADVPLVRRLYQGFQISRVKVARAISARGAGRGKVGEVIITGGYDRPARRRR